MQVIVDFRDSQTFLGVAVGILFCSNLQDTGVDRARGWDITRAKTKSF